jgi:hypothetical protein
VLTLLGEDGLIITSQLVGNVFETGDWLEDLTEVTMLVLQKKPKVTKCTDHRTVSLVEHTTKF